MNHPSVPLRLWFQGPLPDDQVTLHVVFRADGTLRVNWREGLKTSVGSDNHEDNDKTKPVVLPQWWDPADIENVDGSQRYVPGQGQTWWGVFFNDLPVAMPKHPPVVK